MDSKKQHLLLTISLTGSIPDFSSMYHNLGFDVLNTSNMRKALSSIKTRSPSVIIAEFVYAPTYGSQLSNFESLLAAMETLPASSSRLIAVVFPEDIAHCNRVLKTFKNYKLLTFPVNQKELENELGKIN